MLLQAAQKLTPGLKEAPCCHHAPSSQCTISGVQVSDAGTDYICRVSVSRSGMGIATVLGTGTIRVTCKTIVICMSNLFM